jgi:Amt family ammonium transporter
MMQSFTLMALVTVIWALFGYSLVFHSGGRFIGDFGYLFLRGVGAAPDPDYAATIPQQTFMVYQLMFAIITPALITGAFAERMKFSALVLFMALWSILVYDPMAHMVWGKGGLLNAALGGAGGTHFAAALCPRDARRPMHIPRGISEAVCRSPRARRNRRAIRVGAPACHQPRAGGLADGESPPRADGGRA